MRIRGYFLGVFMALEYIISKASKEDIEEILHLQYTAYQSEAVLYNNYSIQPLTQTLEQAKAEFQKCLILIAVVEGKIIGSVRATQEHGTVHIGKLMVLPDYQNQGIGKVLLQAIEREFRDKRFELFTGAKSEKNIALYEKCGYTRFKTESGSPGPAFVYFEKSAKKHKREGVTDFDHIETK
jgi:GNAT superfamily N-acetyltransferase